MNRSKGFQRSKISVCVMAASLLIMASRALAFPVNFVPINSMVNGPPYPTSALAADVVASPFGAPVVVDRFSSSVKSFNPLGATDLFVADSFSFGVEREMKESGEKGGTEDINIGVGELQECTISKSMDIGAPTLGQVSANGNALSVVLQFVSPQGSVSLHSEYTTAQPATFTNVSVVPTPGGHSFDLNFSLLFSQPYNPGLSIINEVMTGDFIPIPEPSSAALLLLGLWASSRLPGRARPCAGRCSG
jgi:hypothetical protein